MLVPTALAAIAAISGCEPDVSYIGYNMWEQFPFDGKRTWVYRNDDSGVDYELRIEKVDQVEQTADYDIVTLEHYVDATGELLLSVRWSSDSINGILLHGYRVYTGGGSDTGSQQVSDEVAFDPPVVFAKNHMAPGDSVQTTSGGWSFTSTLVSSQPCPNYWVPDTADPWECLEMTLDDGDGDDSAGVPVAGTYWLAPRYGPSWFQTTGDPDRWVLRDMVWEPE